MIEIIFLTTALLSLLMLGYVFWGGVGRPRPKIGREFAVIAFGLAAYIAWLLFEKLT